MQSAYDCILLELLLTDILNQFSMTSCFVHVSSVGFISKNSGRFAVLARMQARARKIDLVTRETLAVMAKLCLYLPTIQGAHRPEAKWQVSEIVLNLLLPVKEDLNVNILVVTSSSLVVDVSSRLVN